MKNHLNKKEIIDNITPVVENTAMRYNLIPLEISLDKENDKWFLRIFIFSTDHPVNHKDCENITHGLGDFLDELLPFKYYLEVSSPGLDRKLKSEKEYVLFKGLKAILKLKEAIDSTGDKKIPGRIIDYQKGIGVTFLKENTNKEHIIPLDNILSAKLNED